MKRDKIAEIENLCNKLGIVTYNRTDEYICLEGLNGQSTLITAGNGDFATEIADHLKLMGRDSFRLELNELLSITEHL